MIDNEISVCGIIRHLEMTKKSGEIDLRFPIGKFKILKKLKEEDKFLRVEIKDEGYTEISIEELSPSEQSIMLSKNLDKISESCKKVLELFYYRNLTIDEIVEVTEYKDGNTVRSHKSRCLKRLKSLFRIK